MLFITQKWSRFFVLGVICLWSHLSHTQSQNSSGVATEEDITRFCQSEFNRAFCNQELKGITILSCALYACDKAFPNSVVACAKAFALKPVDCTKLVNHCAYIKFQTPADLVECAAFKKPVESSSTRGGRSTDKNICDQSSASGANNPGYQEELNYWKDRAKVFEQMYQRLLSSFPKTIE